MKCITARLKGKKPQPTPIVVTREGILSCGYACDPTDGCVGDDEHWGFAATGDLGPGESFIYEAPEPVSYTHLTLPTTPYV